MTNFGLAYSFLRCIESQNDFKEGITRFQKCVYFPRYSGVHTLQLRDIINGILYLYIQLGRYQPLKQALKIQGSMRSALTFLIEGYRRTRYFYLRQGLTHIIFMGSCKAYQCTEKFTFVQTLLIGQGPMHGYLYLFAFYSALVLSHFIYSCDVICPAYLVVQHIRLSMIIL